MEESGLQEAPSGQEMTAESAKDALQREVVTIIAGAPEYIEPHQRDDGSGQLKQIELTVPGQGKKKEKVVIGFSAKIQTVANF